MDFLKSSVGALVAWDFRAAEVFDAYGIDYCCNGKESIEEACNKLYISYVGLVNHLKIHLKHKPSPHLAFDFWPMGLLADYIEKKHHRFVKAQVPLIINQFNEALKQPSEKLGSLPEAKETFWGIAEDLLEHLQREERILFPYVRKMEKNGDGEIPFSAPHFDRVRTSLVHLLRDHGREGTWLKNLRRVTNNYQVSVKASYWERMIHPQLEAFDRDMKVHLHLENNILFPRALKAAEMAL